MPSPADACGVSGGCGACPLFGLCGDPAPRGPLCGSCDLGMPARCTCPRFVVDGAGVATDLAADLWPEPSRPLSADVAHHAEARFAVSGDGEVTDRCDAATWRPPSAASLHEALHGEESIGLPDWQGDVAAYLDRMRPAPVCVQTARGVVPCGHGVHVTSREARIALDAPDADPNEPRPVDVGCCGGGCHA